MQKKNAQNVPFKKSAGKQAKEEKIKPTKEALQAADKYIKKGEIKHRVRIQFDVGYQGHPGKTMDNESVTIPDMNLTVRQLLENHTRGVGSDVNVRQPLYLEFPIPTIKDMTDVEEYKRVVADQLQKIETWQQENKETEENEEKL